MSHGPLGNIRRCRNQNLLGTSCIPMSGAVRSNSLLIKSDLTDAGANSGNDPRATRPPDRFFGASVPGLLWEKSVNGRN